MTKLILISDIHLRFDAPVARVDDYENAMRLKLEFLFEYAAKNGGIIVQAGDTFDTPRNWYTLSYFQDLVQKFRRVEYYSVRGQHDKYLYEESNKATNFGVLEKSDRIVHLNGEPYCLPDGVDLYGYDYDGGIKVEYDVDPNRFNILCIHAPILRKKLFAGQTGSIYAEQFLVDHPEYNLILCGDMHYTFDIQDPRSRRIICNAGPMMRAELTEYNKTHQPGFFVLQVEQGEMKEFTWVDIPIMPAADVFITKVDTRQKSFKNVVIEYREEVSLKDFRAVLNETFNQWEMPDDTRNNVAKHLTDLKEGNF